MYQINKLVDNDEKSKVTDYILRSLPDWFGIEESIVEYAGGVKDSDFYAAYEIGKPLGFISIKSNNPYTSEIYVMGILREKHHQGIGRKLLEMAEEELQRNKVKFLMVKTLGESHPDEGYRNTREFYSGMGFYPLQEIKEIWGRENPCLIMVKSV